ncbi:hypothetical protein CEXT_293171 [Caerostris extrusa]|uniref:Uncharacterized protein n=1 Tax=Caerostris extrusa TaxID=172846 RepID=A0AAV4T542_CAEEX|nr:hypothetical protein CEXT_293171 [Caerostris extrusa]
MIEGHSFGGFIMVIPRIHERSPFGGEKNREVDTLFLSNEGRTSTPATGDSGLPYLFPNTSDIGWGCALANLSRREIRAALMEVALCSSASGVLGSGREKSWNLGLNEAIFGGKKNREVGTLFAPKCGLVKFISNKRPFRGDPPPPPPPPSPPKIAGRPISFRTLPTSVRGAPSQISPRREISAALMEAALAPVHPWFWVWEGKELEFRDKRPLGADFNPTTTPATGDSGPYYLFPNTSDIDSGCALANLSRREIRAAPNGGNPLLQCIRGLGSGRGKS